MINLYKTDLKRIFKDKLFLVACIVGGVFALLNPVMNKLIANLMGEMDEGLLIAMGMSAKTMFFNAFAPGDNFGLIAPVLIAIILCKDFNFGTIRNKIISGKSRTAIFLSLFLACFTVLCILLFAHAILTLGVSLIFFDYQAAPFTAQDFGYLMASCALELLVILFVSAMVAFLCVSLKNTGLTIVVYVAFSFVFTIIGAVVMTALPFIDPAKEWLVKLLEFFSNANIFTGGYIGVAEYEAVGLLSVILVALFGTAIFTALGIVIFRKKDLK